MGCSHESFHPGGGFLDFGAGGTSVGCYARASGSCCIGRIASVVGIRPFRLISLLSPYNCVVTYSLLCGWPDTTRFDDTSAPRTILRSIRCSFAMCIQASDSSVALTVRRVLSKVIRSSSVGRSVDNSSVDYWCSRVSLHFAGFKKVGSLSDELNGPRSLLETNME